MRSDIRAFRQAVRNGNDGISLINLTEGAQHWDIISKGTRIANYNSTNAYTNYLNWFKEIDLPEGLVISEETFSPHLAMQVEYPQKEEQCCFHFVIQLPEA